MDAPPAPRLLRAVGLLGLTAIALNGVVGSGIFVLPAAVFRLTGEASLAAYLVAAVLTALVVVCFAEAGSQFDETGGPYLYARAAFGGFAGFLVGWMFFLARLAAGAAIANAFAAYVGYLVPGAAHGLGRVAVITIALFALAALNVAGVRQGSWTVNVLTVAKLLPLLVFVSVGLFFVDPSRVSPTALPEAAPLKQAALLLIFAFGGFENASVPTEESKDPRRHLPVALLATISATALLYVLIQAVAQGTLPELAGSATPLAASARTFMGPGGAVFISVAAALSTLGSTSALALVGPRILFAFARHGQLPSGLAAVHPRTHTPYRAVMVYALLSWAAAVSGRFEQLAAVSAVARLLFSASTCLAVPVLRRQRPASERGFTVPGGWLVPLMAAALSLWLLSGVTRGQALAGAIALGSGITVYAAARLAARARPS